MKVSKIKSSRLISPEKKRKDSDKESPSTASPHSPDHCSQKQPFKSCEDLWATRFETEQVSQMEQIITSIEGNQEEMKAKFDKIVEFLLVQVNKNNEDNKRLAEEVEFLKKEVKQCNEDISIIESMIKPSNKDSRYQQHNGKADIQMDKNTSRNNSNSRSRRLLVNTRSNERVPLTKRTSGKLFPSKLNLKH